jgi:cytoskeletal protein CcmA (bactofilin family)
MFRRRDVTALLETEGQENHQDNPFADQAQPDALDDLPSEASAQPMSYQAKGDKRTLADHFAEQARPVRQASSLPPRQPIPTGGVATSILPTAAPQSATLGALLDNGELEGQKRILRVGVETVLKGEISHCDRVVIEGQVEAQMKEVESMRIAEGGSFNGTARVGAAEISGRFEGDLVVTGLLTIDETGSVKGKIAYGAIEIKRGGSMLGEIRIAGIEDGEAKALPFDLPAKSSLRRKPVAAA